jgi:hypothetical protein
MRTPLGDPPPDYSGARGYADAWGYRLGSGVANLIDFLRDEHRVKYGCDYRLRKIGKNRFAAVPAEPTKHSSGIFGIRYAVEEASKFGVSVVDGRASREGTEV